MKLDSFMCSIIGVAWDVFMVFLSPFEVKNLTIDETVFSVLPADRYETNSVMARIDMLAATIGRQYVFDEYFMIFNPFRIPCYVEIYVLSSRYYDILSAKKYFYATIPKRLSIHFIIRSKDGSVT